MTTDSGIQSLRPESEIQANLKAIAQRNILRDSGLWWQRWLHRVQVDHWAFWREKPS